jgi:hypothetical protein
MFLSLLQSNNCFQETHWQFDMESDEILLIMTMSLIGKDMYRTEESSGLLVLKLVKSDDVI